MLGNFLAETVSILLLTISDPRMSKTIPKNLNILYHLLGGISNDSNKVSQFIWRLAVSDDNADTSLILAPSLLMMTHPGLRPLPIQPMPRIAQVGCSWTISVHTIHFVSSDRGAIILVGSSSDPNVLTEPRQPVHPQ